MEKKAFNNALSNMSFDMAARGAIRHLHDSGLSPKEIAENLSYPLSISRIEQELLEYEKDKISPDAEYEFVKTFDSYGRPSFRKVRRSDHS